MPHIPQLRFMKSIQPIALALLSTCTFMTLTYAQELKDAATNVFYQ